MASPNSASDFSDPTFHPSPSPPPTANPVPPTESSIQAQQRTLHRSTHRSVQSSPAPRFQPILKATSASKSPSQSHSQSRSRSPVRRSPDRQNARNTRQRSANRMESSSQPSFSQNPAQQQTLHFPGPFTSSPAPVAAAPGAETVLDQLSSPPQAPRHRQPLLQPPSSKNRHLDLPPRTRSQPERKHQQSQSNSPTRSSPLRDLQSHSHSHSHPNRPVPTRPNKYTGPASTWRSWTAHERTVATSLDRTRAMDLAAHLYCAYVLRRKAELNGSARGKGRSQSGSRSRSLSRGRGKDKGKAKETEIVDGMGSSVKPASGREGDEQESSALTFDPPRLWTAWPLPPDEVPRDSFLPDLALGGGHGRFRRKSDLRPSAELEECLIAVAARAAKEKWEAREWEEEDDDGLSVKKRRKGSESGGNGRLKSETSIDVQMQDEQGNEEGQNDDDSPQELSSESDDGIQYFSSQMFAAPSSPTESSGSGSDDEEEESQKPVFLADDDQIRQLLLPPTRHVMSQFDDLLQALHKMQSNRRRKTIDIGGRGVDEILGLADIFFSQDVVSRTRERCARLFDLG